MAGAATPSPIPPTRDSDDDDVSWALQTAHVQWRHGSASEALGWLKRAAEAAIEAELWPRAQELNTAVAELERHLGQGGPALKSSKPPAPPSPARQLGTAGTGGTSRAARGPVAPPPPLSRSAPTPATARPALPSRRPVPPPPPPLPRSSAPPPPAARDGGALPRFGGPSAWPPPPPTTTTQRPAPLTDEVEAAEFLDEDVLPSWRGGDRESSPEISVSDRVEVLDIEELLDDEIEEVRSAPAPLFFDDEPPLTPEEFESPGSQALDEDDDEPPLTPEEFESPVELSAEPEPPSESKSPVRATPPPPPKGLDDSQRPGAPPERPGRASDAARKAGSSRPARPRSDSPERRVPVEPPELLRRAREMQAAAEVRPSERPVASEPPVAERSEPPVSRGQVSSEARSRAPRAPRASSIPEAKLGAAAIPAARSSEAPLAEEKPSAGPPEVEGIVLSDVRGLQDLPEASQALFARRARIERLGLDEEISAFAVALVVRGGVRIMPAIAEASCSFASKGEVLFTAGTLADGVALRVSSGEPETIVAVWDGPALDEATAGCPWVADELRLVADSFQALAGAAVGALGERMDDSLRAVITERCEVRTLLPGETLVEQGRPMPGMHIVGGGHIELLLREGDHERIVTTLSAGDFLFGPEILTAAPAPNTARAGPGGALVLFANRLTAHELLVSVPPLLEIFAS